MNKVNYNPDVLTCLANLSNDEVFTPPVVVNQMLDLLPESIWADKNATFLDPVCKSGVFLREIAKCLLKGLEPQIPDLQKRINHIFTKQLYGIAITELTALLSRRSVYCSKLANSKYSVAEDLATPDGNIQFKRTEHSWKNGKCEFCGASKEVYSRDSALETHAYQFIHTNNPVELFNMRFDVIVGNPPYQLNDAGFGTSASAIYDKFVTQAIKLNPRYLTMIIPSRWFSGGKGLDDFRNQMLNDNRIRQIHDFPEASDCFPGVQIKGGVCYFLWDRDNQDSCKVRNYKQGLSYSEMDRPLLEDGCETFIRYNQAISILNKVKKLGEPSLREQISSSKPFGLRTFFKGKNKAFKDSVKLYQSGGIGYVSQDEIISNQDMIDKYKVLVPALGSGSDSFPHPILGKSFVAEPNSACTETYIVAGSYKNRTKAENLVSYLDTKFLRFLVLLCKPAQHATAKVYSFVPVQNFDEPWTDEKLYKKYKIDESEIAFIDSMIRPME